MLGDRKTVNIHWSFGTLHDTWKTNQKILQTISKTMILLVWKAFIIKNIKQQNIETNWVQYILYLAEQEIDWS